MAKDKYLELPISEGELINKLAHQFGRGVQVAVLTQEITALVEFIVLLTKWENIDQTNDKRQN